MDSVVSNRKVIIELLCTKEHIMVGRRNAYQIFNLRFHFVDGVRTINLKTHNFVRELDKYRQGCNHKIEDQIRS